MSFNITLKRQTETKVETVSGIRALHDGLTKFKSQGFEIADISRVV